MQVFSNRPPRGAAFILAFSLLGIPGCKASVPIDTPRVTVESSLHQALSSLSSDADAHLRTAALASWMSQNIQPVRHHPVTDAIGVLAAGSADPVSSAFLFTAMLRRLNIESRTHMFTGLPGFGWYPLVEVLDEDGDHLWDPFTGRYAPDYDGTPLGLTEALSAKTILGPTGTSYEPDPDTLQVPSFSELATHPHFVWNSRFASPVTAAIDFAKHTSVEVGVSDVGSSGEYGPGFAVAGVTTSELGPVVLMHTYVLSGLVTGKMYSLQLAMAQGDPANLLIMEDGVGLKLRKVSGSDTTLTFAASATRATVKIGAAVPSFVGFRTIRWSRQ